MSPGYNLHKAPKCLDSDFAFTLVEAEHLLVRPATFFHLDSHTVPVDPSNYSVSAPNQPLELSYK